MRPKGLMEESGWESGPGGGGGCQNFSCIQVGGRSNPGFRQGSHIEAQVLLFLKEVVEDEFAHKVWVQRVVDHLRPSELDRGWRVSTGPARGQVIPRGRLLAQRGL